jgi:seryl-tRNA synthetase
VATSRCQHTGHSRFTFARDLAFVIDSGDGQAKPAAAGQGHNHVELLHTTDSAEYACGSTVAGSRAYSLKWPGALPSMAIIQCSLKFSLDRGLTPVQRPMLMDKAQMATCAQRADFAQQPYKVMADGEKYLIATSEQPMRVYHANESIPEVDLMCKFSGHSTWSRKEAVSHGRHQCVIFRVHQFVVISLSYTPPSAFLSVSSASARARLMTLLPRSSILMNGSLRLVHIASSYMRQTARTFCPAA